MVFLNIQILISCEGRPLFSVKLHNVAPTLLNCLSAFTSQIWFTQKDFCIHMLLNFYKFYKYLVTMFFLTIKIFCVFLSWTHEQQYLYSSECCFIFATHSVLSTCSLRGSLCNIYARLKAEWTTKPFLRRKWRWRNMPFQCIEETYIFITILNIH